jgi:hypothetical protein
MSRDTFLVLWAALLPHFLELDHTLAKPNNSLSDGGILIKMHY